MSSAAKPQKSGVAAMIATSSVLGRMTCHRRVVGPAFVAEFPQDGDVADAEGVDRAMIANADALQLEENTRQRFRLHAEVACEKLLFEGQTDFAGSFAPRRQIEEIAAEPLRRRLHFQIHHLADETTQPDG